MRIDLISKIVWGTPDSKSHLALRFRAEHTAHRRHQLPPLAGLLLKLRFPAPGQGIESGFAIVFRRAPLGVDPSLSLKALECGIERSVVDEQDILALFLDGPR